MTYLVSAFVAAFVSLGSIFGMQQVEQPLSPQMQKQISAYVEKSMQAPIYGTTQPIAGQTYNLAGAGVNKTGSSITLSSFTVTQTGQKIYDADLSDTFYITLEPGNPAKQEIVSCTLDTQNANGTATFSGCSRGLSPIQPYTASTTLAFSHGGGTQVILSNPPQFYAEFAQLQNTQTITGTWTFADSPLLTTDCTVASLNTEICAKAYIDSVAIAGASNGNETTKGIFEAATGVEMASSTATGSTGARLVLTSSYASSSPWKGATSTIVMTQLDGKISPLFIATSSVYTYNMAASTTYSGVLNEIGTTSILATSLTNTPSFSINGLTQKWPTTRPTATSTLAFDPSGNVTYYNPNGYICASTTLTSAVASTTLIGIATSTDLRVIIDMPANAGVAATFLSVQFNGDTGSNYGWLTTDDGNARNGQGAVTIIRVTTGLATLSSIASAYVVLDIANRPGFTKRVSSKSVLEGGNAVAFANGMGYWANQTAAIGTITLGVGNGLLPINTRISVQCSNQ